MKYEALGQRLKRTPGDRIRFSFRDIEGILGFSLPNSARAYAPWWANSGHVQAEAWMGAGWRTCQVDVPGEKVSFERALRPGAPRDIGETALGVAETAAPFVADDAIVIRRDDLRGGA